MCRIFFRFATENFQFLFLFILCFSFFNFNLDFCFVCTTGALLLCFVSFLPFFAALIYQELLLHGYWPEYLGKSYRVTSKKKYIGSHKFQMLNSLEFCTVCGAYYWIWYYRIQPVFCSCCFNFPYFSFSWSWYNIICILPGSNVVANRIDGKQSKIIRTSNMFMSFFFVSFFPLIFFFVQLFPQDMSRKSLSLTKHHREHIYTCFTRSTLKIVHLLVCHYLK